MQHHAILYSLDPKVTLSQLQDIVVYDNNKYTKLQEWMQEHNV
ncbi:MAG: hypothetical protein WCL18_07130 [bacterium]